MTVFSCAHTRGKGWGVGELRGPQQPTARRGGVHPAINGALTTKKLPQHEADELRRAAAVRLLFELTGFDAAAAEGRDGAAGLLVIVRMGGRPRAGKFCIAVGDSCVTEKYLGSSPSVIFLQKLLMFLKLPKNIRAKFTSKTVVGARLLPPNAIK